MSTRNSKLLSFMSLHLFTLFKKNCTKASHTCQVPCTSKRKKTYCTAVSVHYLAVTTFFFSIAAAYMILTLNTWGGKMASLSLKKSHCKTLSSLYLRDCQEWYFPAFETTLSKLGALRVFESVDVLRTWSQSPCNQTTLFTCYHLIEKWHKF